MASSRKSKPADRGRLDLAALLAARLKTIVGPGDRLLLALSGGVDSVVLLDILARIAPRLRVDLSALHVDHQLSPHSKTWAKFCREACRARGIPCRVVKVDVAHGNSTESAARVARYAALRKSRADFIVLAHNADDQAETVLLQLFRGAGVRGLAAMAPVRKDEGRGMRDEGCKTSLVRPLLDVSREQIEAYAKRRELVWVEDESNAGTAYLRNWVRHELAPRIAERVPGYRTTLVRAASNMGEAAELLDDLAALDAGDAAAGGPLPLVRLRELSVPRAKNLLRFVIAARGWRLPDADRLAEALRQALKARADARVHVDLGDCELRRRAGLLYLLPTRAVVPPDAVVVWRGEPEITLEGLGGILAMRRERGIGMSLARLETGPVTIRARLGGERLQPAANRPIRTVKNLLQEASMPAWERDRVPFIYAGDTLACIPGVAVDHRFHAGPGEPSVEASWRPSAGAASRGPGCG
ncbi:MAG: tilS [Betaproteobacteria bacterium]|nr:tilS [Betaproteobacteria bacterium]